MPLQPNRYGDTLPSMLTPGEVVLGPKEAQRLGRPLLDVLGKRIGQATVGGEDDKFDEFGRRSFGDGWSQTPEQEELEEIAAYMGEQYSDYFGDSSILQSAKEAEKQQARGLSDPVLESQARKSLLEELTRRGQEAILRDRRLRGDTPVPSRSNTIGSYRGSFEPALPAKPVERLNAPPPWSERKPTVTSSLQPASARSGVKDVMVDPAPAATTEVSDVEVSPQQFLADALAGKGDRSLKPYEGIFDSIATEASREAVSRARAQGKDAGPVGIQPDQQLTADSWTPSVRNPTEHSIINPDNRYFAQPLASPITPEEGGGFWNAVSQFFGNVLPDPINIMSKTGQLIEEIGDKRENVPGPKAEQVYGNWGKPPVIYDPDKAVSPYDIEDWELGQKSDYWTDPDMNSFALRGEDRELISPWGNVRPDLFTSNNVLPIAASALFNQALPPIASGIGYVGGSIAETMRELALDEIARGKGYVDFPEFVAADPTAADLAFQNYRNAPTSGTGADYPTGGGGEDNEILEPTRPRQMQSTVPALPSVDPLTDLINTITENTVNPFGDTEEGNLEFNNVIQSGIDRMFAGLGANPNQQLVDATFNRPNVGDIILGQERGIRQGTFANTLGETFTGGAFDNIDDDIINSIVEERASGQRGTVARGQARGNYNPAGVLAANEELTSQIPQATERVQEVGQNVLQGSQQDINALRDVGFGRIQDYTLGQPDIDFSDLISQREGLIGDRVGTLRGDIGTTLGSEPLFDINQALLSGGRSQGQVSGAQPNTLLDTIAESERRGRATDIRGVGTRGSGAF